MMKAFVLSCLCVAVAADDPPQVITAQGPIIGSRQKYGVERYAGIPYALPPLGERRFARAVLNSAPWAGGQLNATVPGAPCIQNPLGDPRPPEDKAEAPPPSEDCLQLNIYKPPDVTEPLPVMVYLFGGGLCGGFASNKLQDGTTLAHRQDVIVVTVSYRLGALGFLPLPDTFPDKGSGGMNGMYDAVVALQWLQLNAHFFGGDPSRVTLFGQSSGAYMICTLSVSPAAQGLFHRAILQSGPCIQGPPGKGWGPVALKEGQAIAQEIMTQLNVKTVAELRQVPAEKVQWPAEYMNNLTLAPYFSGYFPDSFVMPGTGDSDAIERRWADGDINPSELIVGHTSKDGTAAFYGIAPTMGTISPDKNQTTPADYVAALRSVYDNDLAARVLKQYPMRKYGDSAQSAFIQTDADAYVICPSYSVAAYAAAAGRKVYAYEFAHFQPNRDDPHGYGCDNGVELDVVLPDTTVASSKHWASHGSAVKFVFGTTLGPDGLGPPNDLRECDYTATEQVLSDSMGAYWAAFARTGDPNNGCRNGDCTQWPAYTPRPKEAHTLVLVDGSRGSQVEAVPGLHAEDCAFWATVDSGEGGVPQAPLDPVCGPTTCNTTSHKCPQCCADCGLPNRPDCNSACKFCAWC